MDRPIGLAGVLATFGAHYRAAHALGGEQAKAWRAILACRTGALGGHVEACDACGTSRHVYHSCRNRHCPLCQTRAKEAWIAARRSELLPVPYFHLVFTLPHALHGLVATQARRMYETLFTAAAGTLTEFAASQRHLGGEAAFTLVLHTWKQDLALPIPIPAKLQREVQLVVSCVARERCAALVVEHPPSAWSGTVLSATLLPADEIDKQVHGLLFKEADR